jgi:hypothetical protein
MALVYPDRTFTKALGKRPKNPTSVIVAEAIEKSFSGIE